MGKSIMKKLLLILFISLGLIGNTFAMSKADELKKFVKPEISKSGIYIFREERFQGSAIHPKVFIDNSCAGKLPTEKFQFIEVSADNTYTIYSKSDWVKNDKLTINAKAGELYFVELSIKEDCLFVCESSLKLVHESKGMQEIFELDFMGENNCE
jgi:hypothetical protein